MWQKLYLLVILVFSFSGILAQPIIYNDATTLVTGFWDQNGTLTETTSNSPYEGSSHYEFSYSFTGYWAGMGLNLANWGPNGYDFTGYTHLQLAYRGMNGDHRITLMLRSNAGDGNVLTLGTSTSSYTVTDIPIFALAAATDLDLTSVTELAISISSDTPSGSGTLYFDDIQLVNLGSGTPTSAATQQRAANMQRGINLNNWLEAYWLIPSNSFPDEDKFDADDVADFRALGFDAIRLPVTFEHLAGPAPDYTLNTGHAVFGLIDDAIDWAANNNMKLIIDMHHGTTTLTDANYTTELPRLVAIWEQIIALYGYLNPERYLFEVYNEPHAISNNNFRIVAQALVDVIRDAGHSHSVLVGASGYNSAGELLSFTPLDDPDIIYTFHFYEPYAFTHQQMSWTNPPYLASRAFPIGSDEADVSSSINAAGEWEAFYNAPVVVGEFGVTSEAGDTDRCNWIELIGSLFDDNGFPWFYWGATDISNGFGFFDGGVISVGDMTPCFGTALGLPATVLPIEQLSDVAIECQGAELLLSWSLITDEPGQQAVQFFSPERRKWEDLTTLNMNPDQRAYTAKVPNDFQAYRVRIVELDGTVHFTRIAENTCNSVDNWRIFPNPTNGWLFVSNAVISEAVDIQIQNSTGLIVWQQAAHNVDRNIPIHLPSLPAGLYQLQIWQKDQILRHERIIIH